jgi:hypothetical protein
VPRGGSQCLAADAVLARPAAETDHEVELLGQVVGPRLCASGPREAGVSERPGAVRHRCSASSVRSSACRAACRRHFAVPSGCRGFRRSPDAIASSTWWRTRIAACRGPVARTLADRVVVRQGLDGSRARPRRAARRARRRTAISWTIRRRRPRDDVPARVDDDSPEPGVEARAASPEPWQLAPCPQAPDLQRVVGVGLVAGDRQGEPSQPPRTAARSGARTRFRVAATGPRDEGEVGASAATLASITDSAAIASSAIMRHVESETGRPDGPSAPGRVALVVRRNRSSGPAGREPSAFITQRSVQPIRLVGLRLYAMNRPHPATRPASLPPRPTVVNRVTCVPSVMHHVDVAVSDRSLLNAHASCRPATRRGCRRCSGSSSGSPASIHPRSSP